MTYFTCFLSLFVIWLFFIYSGFRDIAFYFRVLTPEKMTEEQRNEKLAAIKVAYPLNNEKQNGTVLFTK